MQRLKVASVLPAREQEVESDMAGTHPTGAPISFGWLKLLDTVRARLAWNSGGFCLIFLYYHNIIGICSYM